MKASDARAMSIDQIDDEVLKLKKEQFNLRFQRATGQLENTARVRVVRRDIARLKTIARPEACGRAGAASQGRRPRRRPPKPKRAPKAKAPAKAKSKSKSKSKG